MRQSHDHGYWESTNGVKSYTMNDGSGYVRLAITVFDRPAKLCSALLALMEEGLAAEQLCLVALSSTMKRMRRLMRKGESGWTRVAVLTENLVDWPGAPIGRRVVATSSPLVEALPHVLDGGNVIKTQVHSPAGDGHLFSEHIRDGGVALIVGSATPAQQAGSTRILLAQSAHGVKTYEFNLPKSAGV